MSETKAQQAAAVQVVSVEQRDLKERVSAVGTLAPAREVTVRPQIAEILKEIHFQEGDRVTEGQLLFTLQSDAIEHRLAARQAALKAARAETENSGRMLKRRRELLDQKLIAGEAFDAVQTRYQTALARVERL